MIAIRKTMGMHPELVEIDNDLTALQEAVGGYIETYTTPLGVVICDEESRLKGNPPCMVIDGVEFVGTCLIVGQDGEEFTDVDPDAVGAFFKAYVAHHIREDGCDG